MVVVIVIAVVVVEVVVEVVVVVVVHPSFLSYHDKETRLTSPSTVHCEHHNDNDISL